MAIHFQVETFMLKCLTKSLLQARRFLAWLILKEFGQTFSGSESQCWDNGKSVGLNGKEKGTRRMEMIGNRQSWTSKFKVGIVSEIQKFRNSTIEPTDYER